MGDLILYVALAAAGYVFAARIVKHKEKLAAASMIQIWAILLLVFSMGARMGANEEIIKNLNRIGLQAFLMAVAAVAASIAAVSGARRLLKLDAVGRRIGEAQSSAETSEGIAEEEDAGERAAAVTTSVRDGLPRETPEAGTKQEGGSGSNMTVFIVCTVALGMIFGWFLMHASSVQYEDFDAFAGVVIKGGLCLLLFLVGIDLGIEDTFFSDIRQAGLGILLIPLAVCVGTLGGSAACALFLPLSLGECLSIGAGFGWYSMAPVIIMEKGFVTASAISFMHNVFRELLALLFIPAVAKRIGYVEAVSLPGSGASDVCLPLIVKSTRGGIAIYAFVTGIGVSVLVPVLVPLFL